MSGNAGPGGLPNPKPAARTRAQLQAAATAATAAVAAAAAGPGVAAGAAAPDATAILVQILQQQQLQAAATAANAELAAADALAQQRRAGAGAPPLFNGVRGGDELAVNTWLDALESWFNLAHIDSSADEERIEVAAASMRGAAQQWWTATRANDAAAVVAGGASTIGTWAGVVAQLRKAYLPQDPARWAMQQLKTLEHGSNADVQTYTNRFLQLDMMLLGAAKPGELARVFAYEQGLPESYRVKSAEKQHATLAAAVEAALALWNAKAVARAQSHSSSSRQGATAKLSHTQTDEASDEEREEPTERGPSSSSAAAPSSSHGATSRLEQKMDALISAMQMQYGGGGGRGRNRGGRSAEQRAEGEKRPARSRTPGVSDELAKQRLQARVCIKCAEPGHYARDCKNELKTN